MFLYIPGRTILNLDKVTELSINGYQDNVFLDVYFEAERDEEGFCVATSNSLAGYKTVDDAEHALWVAFEGLFYKSDKLIRFPAPYEYYGTFQSVLEDKEDVNAHP